MVYVNMNQVGKIFLKDFLIFVVILSFRFGLLRLLIQIEEYKKLCELKREETYAKKKELDKLRLTVTKMRETVTTSTVVRKNKNQFFMSDPRLLNIHCLKQSRRFFKKGVDFNSSSCHSGENVLSMLTFSDILFKVSQCSYVFFRNMTKRSKFGMPQV